MFMLANEKHVNSICVPPLNIKEHNVNILPYRYIRLCFENIFFLWMVLRCKREKKSCQKRNGESRNFYVFVCFIG